MIRGYDWYTWHWGVPIIPTGAVYSLGEGDEEPREKDPIGFQIPQKKKKRKKKRKKK